MKKWTYLVAAGMLLGATPVFTGCIDNDEPEGITILRKAKAELIVAKKAVVDAEALRLKAEASKLEAEAKVKEAEADLTKANAELVRAQAAQLAALTEAEKAKYAAEIAKIEAQIAKIKAETEAAIAQAEATRQAAEAAHQLALIQIEKAKNTLTAEELQMLSMYQNRYDAAATEYNNRHIDYVNAQNEYLNALAAAEERNDDIDYKRILEKNIQDQEENVAVKDQAWKDAEKKLDEVKGYVPGQLAVKLEDAKAELNKIQDKLNAINVKITEERIKNDAEYKKQADLHKTYNDLLYNEEGKLYAEPLTIEFPNIGIPGFWGKYEIIEESIYGFNVTEKGDIVTSYGHNGYLAAINEVNSFINALTDKQLDKDDQKWTEASINEMKRELAGLEKVYDADLKTWQNAVDGYNVGKGTLYAKYFGYTELDAAIKEYNAAAEKMNPLRVEYYSKVQARNEAEFIWNNYINISSTFDKTALGIKNIADKAAWEAYNKIAKSKNQGWPEDGTAWAAYRATIKTLEDAITKAEADVNVAEVNIKLLTEKLRQDPTNTALQTQLNAAQEALGKDVTEGLRKVLYDAEQKSNQETPKAIKKRDNAISLAWHEYLLALEQNKKDYENHKIDWNVEYDSNGNKVDPAYVNELKTDYDNAVKTEADAYEKYAPAYEAAIKLYDALVVVYNQFRSNVLADASSSLIIITNELTINSVGDEVMNGTAPTFNIDDLKVNSKNFIIVASRNLYGVPFGKDHENDQNYGFINDLIQAERITPLTKEELNKIIIAEYYLDETEFFAPNYYENFGSFGNKLAKERDIDYANAFINEQPTIDAILKTLNDYIAKLEEQKDAQAKVVMEAFKQMVAQDEVIEEFEEANMTEYRELSVQSQLQGDLVATIELAINANGTSDEAKRDEAAIKALIKQWTDNVKAAKDELFDANTLLQKAEKFLEDWNNELVDIADMKKLKMENAGFYLEKADTQLAKATAELQMILERLGVTTEEAE